jgi:hypothetical protein
MNGLTPAPVDAPPAGQRRDQSGGTNTTEWLFLTKCVDCTDDEIKAAGRENEKDCKKLIWNDGSPTCKLRSWYVKGPGWTAANQEGITDGLLNNGSLRNHEKKRIDIINEIFRRYQEKIEALMKDQCCSSIKECEERRKKADKLYVEATGKIKPAMDAWQKENYKEGAVDPNTGVAPNPKPDVTPPTPPKE